MKKENLRDNKTNKELVLSILAELSTKEFSEATGQKNFGKHTETAHRNGNVARKIRLRLEEETDRSVVSPLNARSIRTGLRLLEEDEE